MHKRLFYSTFPHNTANIDTHTRARATTNVTMVLLFEIGLEDFMRVSGMDSTRDIRTSRDGRLACSTVAPWRERDDRCLSPRRAFSFASIDPASERFPFSSVSGLFDRGWNHLRKSTHRKPDVTPPPMCVHNFTSRPTSPNCCTVMHTHTHTHTARDY